MRAFWMSRNWRGTIVKRDRRKGVAEYILKKKKLGETPPEEERDDIRRNITALSTLPSEKAPHGH